MRDDVAALGVTRAVLPDTWVERRRLAVLGWSLAAVVVLLILHYSTTLQMLGLHNLMRRLFYIPVIVAAIASGLWGGLLTSGLASLGYVPHLIQLSRAGNPPLDHALELVILPVIGILVGGFADSSRRARAAAAERGRLAALGEVGIAMMAQAEGPLAAIEGQAEMLAFVGSNSAGAAVPFAAHVIRAEVERTRRLLTDLRGLGDAASRRPARVDLSALLANTVRDLSAARAARSRVSLAPIAERVMVRADRSVLAFSLRSLLLCLLDAVEAPGLIGLALSSARGEGAWIEIRVLSGGAPLPDLERSLNRVYGASTRDYRFRQALCIHCLTGEGASVDFRRSGPREAVIRIWFPHAAARRADGPGSATVAARPA